MKLTLWELNKPLEFVFFKLRFCLLDMYCAFAILLCVLLRMIVSRIDSVVINGPVISFSISAGGNNVNEANPVAITFQHFEVHYNN